MNELALQKHLSYDIKENFNKSISIIFTRLH